MLLGIREADVRYRETLGSEDAALLLDRLLFWVVRLVNAAEGALVLRKMCASLVTYFLRPSVSWQHCVRHLLCCFRAGGAVAQQTLSENPPTDELVRQLSQLQLLTGLWFCVGLVEEVGKTDDASIETYGFYSANTSKFDAHDRIADIATVREWFPILVTLYRFYDTR